MVNLLVELNLTQTDLVIGTASHIEALHRFQAVQTDRHVIYTPAGSSSGTTN
jgi:hypothetical protein